MRFYQEKLHSKWRIRLLFLFFCMILTLQAQGKSITLDLQRGTLKEAVDKLKKQTGYQFFYEDEIGRIPISNVKIDHDDIDQALSQILANSPVTYKVDGKVVYLTEKRDNLESASFSKEGDRRITGRVIDARGETLIGVNVTEAGTMNGVITDINGIYSIVLTTTDQPMLKFSYIGFKETEIPVGKEDIIDVVLEEDVSELDEVVIVGYGTQKRASVIGSITSVEPKKLQIGTSRSISNNLSGMLAGVIGVQRSGEPGWDDSDFWIRGVSSFRGNTNPLVLVDGIERSLNNIDIEEIESISILKDASASAVYGVRGANGVILITTKRGEVGPPKVTFRAEKGFSAPTKLPEFISSGAYLSLLNEIAVQEGETPLYDIETVEKYINQVDPELYPNVNWLDLVTKDFSDNIRVNVNASGGTPMLRYAVETAYFGENGIIERDKKQEWDSSIKLNRFNVRSNVDLNITRNTLLRVNLGGFLQQRRMPGVDINGIFSWSFTIPPFAHPPIYMTGEIPRRNGAANPWAMATQTGFQTWYDSQIQSLVSLEQDLKDWLPGLKARAMFSFDKYQKTATLRTKTPTYYSPAVARNNEGELILTIQAEGSEYLGTDSQAYWGNHNTYFETSVTYNNNFGNHYLDGLLLYNQKDYNTGAAQPFRSQGFAGRLSYSYNQRYIGEFNFGYNGSENFAKNNRFGFFPSFAIGWYLSEEDFMLPYKDTFSKIKLRGSWGLAGNDQIGGRRFAYLGTIESSQDGGYTYGMNRDYQRIGRWEGEIGVSALTWETVAKTNIGFELGLWNTIDFQIDLFKEARRDIFMERQTIPSQNGFIKTPWANYGKVNNRGVDLTLQINKQFSKDLYFSFLHTLTYAKNEIVEIDEPLSVIGTNRARTGHPVGQLFGLIDEGLYTMDDFEKDASGSLAVDENGRYILAAGLPIPQFGPVRPGDIKYKDINSDGIITVLDQSAIGGTVNPQLVYGVGSSLKYRNVDFGFFLQGQGKTYRMISSGIIPGSSAGVNNNIYSNYRDSWTVENPRQDVFYPRLSTQRIENNTQSSTWWIKDMSLMRVKNLELGYHMPNRINKSLSIDNSRFFIRGTNLFTFSGFKLWDPEIGTNTGFQYPIMKSISMGFEMHF